jgi:hypothetical protein
MQLLAFREKREAFLRTATAMDVRRALRDTRWGKRYIYLLWSGGVLLVIIAFLTSSKPAGGWRTKRGLLGAADPTE